MGHLSFLADTNALSELARPRPNPSFVIRWRQHFGGIAVSATTWHEAWYGVERLPSGTHRRLDLERYLTGLEEQGLTVLPYTAEAARWHSFERCHRAGLGRPLPYQDGQIASVAVTRQLVLITANTADFAGLTDLIQENWLGP